MDRIIAAIKQAAQDNDRQDTNGLERKAVGERGAQDWASRHAVPTLELIRRALTTGARNATMTPVPFGAEVVVTLQGKEEATYRIWAKWSEERISVRSSCRAGNEGEPRPGGDWVVGEVTDAAIARDFLASYVAARERLRG